MCTVCAVEGRRRRGMTLAEVLVAMFLGSLVLHIIVSLLLPTMRLSRKASARIDLEQASRLTQERVARDLRGTTRGGIVIGEVAGVQLLSARPLIGALSQSRREWSHLLIVYKLKEEQLERFEVDLSTRTLAPTRASVPPNNPTPDQLLSALAPPSGVLLARWRMAGVKELTVEFENQPLVKVSLTLAKGDGELRTVRTVYLANSAN